MVAKCAFGHLPTGQEVSLYELSIDDVSVRVSDLGATIVSALVPDRLGSVADIVLGYGSAEAYYPNDPYYLGATVGPSANRVKGATVAIDGRTYRMLANDGANNLHTDPRHALHAVVWEVDADPSANAVAFSCSIADGVYGLPGNRRFTVRYELRSDGDGGAVLHVEHEAVSDARTLINMTNHSYFNLAGEGSPDLGGQTLALNAGAYLPITDETVPTGEVAPVEGTPFDFRSPKPLSEGLSSNHRQIALAHGYDHCFCVDGYDGTAGARHDRPRLAARVVDPASGRALDVSITQPGIQLYTGNFLDIKEGKDGHAYPARSGFALEPEYFPAANAHPDFVQPIFGPDEPYHEEFEYRFHTV